MAKVAVSLLARSKQAMIKKKQKMCPAGHIRIAVKRAAGDMYATFDIV